MSTYPASIDNGSSLPVAIDGLTPVQGSVFNALRNATLAIETTLGPQPAGVYGSVAGRLTTLEGSVGNIQSISLAGDLGGTLASPLVIGIQGYPVSNMHPNPGQVLTYNGIAWVPGSASNVPITFGGDLLGNSSTQTVIGIQGFAVSTATPTAGQVLEYNGSEYVPITLSGVFVAGGDLTGSSTSQTVHAIQGVVISGVASSGKVLEASSSTAASWQTPAPGFTAGGDLSGTSTSQTVIGIDNVPLSITSLATNQILQYNGTDWVNVAIPSGFTAGGDLTGTSTNQNVVNIHGASVPAAGSLTTGNVLQVAGPSALSYAPVNLAGGSNYVTGSLPTGNQAAQTMGGAVGGTTAASTISLTSNADITGVLPTANQADQSLTLTGDVTSSGGNTGGATTTVAAIQGVTISSTPSSGYVLTATSSSTANWQAISSGSVTLGGDVTGAANTNTVGKIQGNTVTSGALTKGQFFVASSTSNWAATTLSGDISESATTPGDLTVASIQGIVISGTPSTGQVLEATSPTAASWQTPSPGFTAGGDLTGTSTSQTVAKIDGASVPAAGSLTTGNVLQVTGSSALSYAPVNLAGGSNYVTGALPNANQAPQTMGGDVTGTTAASTVVKLQGNSVSAGGITEGQFLVGSASNTWTPETISGDISSSVSIPGKLTVSGIQNISVPAPSGTNTLLTYSSGAYTWSAVSGSSLAEVGLAANRPAATGSGLTYYCSDAPLTYVDDPNTVAWQQRVDGRPTTGPGLISNYTVCGNGALTQFADSIEFCGFMTGVSKTVSALRASAALGASAVWSVSLKVNWQSEYGQANPIVGVSVSNGTTTGTSVAYTGALYTSSNSWGGAELVSITTGAGRTSGGQLFANTAIINAYISPIINLRLLNDGALLHFQGSQDGFHWQDFGGVASVSGFTDYGFTIGNEATTGAADGQQAFVYENLLSTPAVGTVIGSTNGTPGSLTLSSADIAKFRTGDIVSVHAVSGAAGVNNSANNPGGFGSGGTQWQIEVVGNTVVLITSTVSGAWTSGGTVTLVGR
jgi:hypothetical protein